MNNMSNGKLNEAPILDQIDGYWQQMAMFLLWKLSPDAPVRISLTDMEACAQNFAPGQPVIFTHGHSDSIELSLVTEDRASAIAAYQNTLRGRG